MSATTHINGGDTRRSYSENPESPTTAFPTPIGRSHCWTSSLNYFRLVSKNSGNITWSDSTYYRRANTGVVKGGQLRTPYTRWWISQSAHGEGNAKWSSYFWTLKGLSTTWQSRCWSMI